MTWDGVPEHRGLRGENDPPPHLSAERRQQYLDRINAYRAARQRQEAEAQAVPGMPPDPFSSNMVGAAAQVEMFRSLVEGGMSEPQALYYLACLVQVGLAMQLGRFEGMPPWPTDGP